MRKMKKRLFHQLLSIILCIVLVLGYTPLSVSADTGMAYSIENVTYVDVDEKGERNTKTCPNAVEVTAEDTDWGTEETTSWYVVTGTVEIGSAESIQRITVKGDVHLILADGASLTVNGGIGLNDENSNITIYGQEEGTGKLITQNVVDGSAGIGGNESSSAGTITINGGIINTQGGNAGSGIGSGIAEGHCGVITINGGNITAIGKTNAPGIGNTNKGSCEAIEITGGEITATGGFNGAGIGSGWDAISGPITISGGKINAEGGTAGAGIGSGGRNLANCERITITGGEIIATGGMNASGIGAGESAFYREIIISGGKITAIGTNYGNGIGGKYDAGDGIVNITGGEVTATGGAKVIAIMCSSSQFFLSGNAVVYINSNLDSRWSLTKGIFFSGKSGIVYGETTIPKEFEIPVEYTLTIPEDASLIIEHESIIENNGQIINNGQLINNGSIVNKNVFINNNLISNTGIFSNAGSFSTIGTIECENHYKTDSLCSGMRGCDLCGYECIEPHTGEYTASANVITVDNCYSNADMCGYIGGELRLITIDMVYDGTRYESVLIADNFPVEVSAEEIVYFDSEGNQLEEAPVAPGNYIAKVTVENATAEASFEINKKERDAVAVNMEDYVYNGTVSTPSLFAEVAEHAEVEYYYSTENKNTDGTKWLDITATTLEPGTYYMYAVVSETANYHAYTTAPVAFTISKATASSDIKAENVSCTYDGKNHGITVTGTFPAGAMVRYGTEKGKYDLTESPVYINAGTYTVYYQVTARGYSTVEGSATIEIKKADRTPVTVKMTGYTYAGTVSTPSLSAGVAENAGVVYYYSTENKNTAGTKWANITAVTLKSGTYYMYAVVSETGNYKAYTTVPVAFTISKASIKNAKATLKTTSYYYDGKSKKPAVTVKLNGKTLVNKTDYTVSYKNNKNIGKATVTITGKGNYNGSLTKPFTIKVKNGKTFTSGNNKYKVTSSSTVEFTGLKNSKKTTAAVPKTVKYGGKTFNVTAIAKNAFKNNIKLKKITVGENVKTIGATAFYGCKNLKTILIKSTKLTSVGKNALKGIHANAKIEVPKSKLSKYKKLFANKGQGSKVTIEKIK